jgi:hypothetical protein
LQREHAQGTSAFLRLARLNGWDLLYGAYTAYALAGATRIYLLWGAPFLLAIATVVYDSLLTAIGFCVRAGLCYLGWSLLFQTLRGAAGCAASNAPMAGRELHGGRVGDGIVAPPLAPLLFTRTVGEWYWSDALAGECAAADVGDALRVLALATVPADRRDDGTAHSTSCCGAYCTGFRRSRWRGCLRRWQRAACNALWMPLNPNRSRRRAHGGDSAGCGDLCSGWSIVAMCARDGTGCLTLTTLALGVLTCALIATLQAWLSSRIPQAPLRFLGAYYTCPRRL